MDNVIHDLSTLPADDAALIAMFHVSAPRDNSGGKGKSARIGYGSAERVVYFQTPRVYCPFGTDTFKTDFGSEKLTLLASIRNDAKGASDFVRLIKAMDEALVLAAFQNQDAWFGTPSKDYKSIDIIRDRHHTLLQARDGYEPQVKFKITESTQVYNKINNMERIEGQNVPEKTTVRAIVAFGPAWVAGGKFGVQARCEQAAIIAAGTSLKRTLAVCVLKDDDDDDEAPPADAIEAASP